MKHDYTGSRIIEANSGYSENFPMKHDYTSSWIIEANSRYSENFPDYTGS